MQTEQKGSESKPFIPSSQTKPTKKKQEFTGLDKEEVKTYSKQPCWKNLRLLLLLLIIFILIACILAAVIIVIYHSNCAPKPKLAWWQKDAAYQIQLTNFKDSNGDGLGDLDGLISKLDYLDNLGVKTLSLSNINSKDAPNKIDPVFGDESSLKNLRKELDKKGMHLILDMPLIHLEENDKETLEFWLKNYADGIRVTKSPSIRNKRIGRSSFDNSTIIKKFNEWKNIAEKISTDTFKEKIVAIYPPISNLKTAAKMDTRFIEMNMNRLKDTSKFVTDINGLYKSLEKSDWPIFPLADFDSKRILDSLEGSKISRVVQGIIMLLKGTPLTMYGDELELKGENVYMLWDSSNGCGFTSEKSLGEYIQNEKAAESNDDQNQKGDNLCEKTAEKAFASGAVNSPALLYKNLIKLREEPSLLWGEVKTSSKNNENLISFVREAKGFEAYLIAANVGDNEQAHNLQAKHDTPKSAKVAYFYSINESRQNAYKVADSVDTEKITLKNGELLIVSFKRN